MLGADGNLWVVKFQNNPQHVRVLANEMIATQLAEAVGLSVPVSDVIDVSEWLIEHTSEMRMDVGIGQRTRYSAGLQFGSRYVGGLTPGQVIDFLAEPQLAEVRNLTEFAGMLAMDKWTGNCNGRQVVFERKARELEYRAKFIDQGFCFNAGEWTFPDNPLRGAYWHNRVYANVTDWKAFEPWLTRIEELPEEKLWAVAKSVPSEWYGSNYSELERLIEALLLRRGRVRELIALFRDSNRAPFPFWEREAVVATQ